jgi:hypothetical protein
MDSLRILAAKGVSLILLTVRPHLVRIAFFLALVWVARPAAAVVIATANGSGNVVITGSPPADVGSTPQPGLPLANVGKRDGDQASFTYLGNGWVITAGHVNTTGKSAVFNGTSYPLDNSTEAFLLNLGAPSAQMFADLKVVRLSGGIYPSLPTLTISSSPLTLNTNLVLAGAGRDRNASRSPPSSAASSSPALRNWGPTRFATAKTRCQAQRQGTRSRV